VADYLARYPEIAALLPDICAKLRQTFGAAELALSVYTDPEIADRYLSLYVRFKHYVSGIVAQIEPAAAQFDDALATSAGHLLITTDFRPPRGNDGV
jgi:hypothetical protein